MHELEERHGVGEASRVRLDERGVEGHALEGGGAAGGERLPEPVPIVHDGDARRAHRHGRRHRPARLVVGGEVDVVREERAGGVELPPLDHGLAVAPPHHRVEGADLGGPVSETPLPIVSPAPIRAIQAPATWARRSRARPP